jgi:ubiquinone/menaquinone biosynthesis C-methylase UbiE
MLDEQATGQGDYFIEAESAAEMARLIKQDHFITQAMGGLFEERSDVNSMKAILDLGCGPGQWVLDVAFAYPNVNVAGIDISDIMVQYANARVRSQNVPNASFGVMDITAPLDFSDNSFDMVNERLIAFLSPTQWSGLLQECKRIVRPGGIIRLTESDVVSTSVATDALFGLFYRAMARARQSFSASGRVLGINSRLGYLLRNAGCVNVQQKASVMDFSAGSEGHETLCEVVYVMFSLMKPFLIGTGVSTPEEVDHLLEQMQIEMHTDDFSAVMFLLTAWGEKPL